LKEISYDRQPLPAAKGAAEPGPSAGRSPAGAGTLSRFLSEAEKSAPPGRVESAVVDWVRERLSEAADHRARKGRPLVTLTYAQSLDGSIAIRRRSPLALSSDRSLTMTHALRAGHDAILVGIGCVLADNPRLTVRLAPGGSPQPVVLDSRLRFPRSSRLLEEKGPAPWIMTAHGSDEKRRKRLESGGAKVFRMKPAPEGVDLLSILSCLADKGVNSVMVEGGARIITSFMRSRMVDQVVITIAPVLVGGLRGVERPLGVSPGAFPRVKNTVYERAEEDLIMCGEPDWGQE
jgi:GTP cyclohydrolase II